MGIDTGSALVVGLPYKEMFFVYMEDQSPAEDADFYDWVYGKDMSVFSPYYDADGEDCLFGFKVAGTDYTYGELEDNYEDTISMLRSKFYKLTGKVAKVYVTANVW